MVYGKLMIGQNRLNFVNDVFRFDNKRREKLSPLTR